MTKKRVKLFEIRVGENTDTGEKYDYIVPNIGDTIYNIKGITIQTQDGKLHELDKKSYLYINNIREGNLRLAKLGHITEDEANARNKKVPNYILDDINISLEE